ncbi:DUF421 domain-containing protein [Rhizobacter sp. Root1221]|uniref:DUF421 domain-containing protein n=1 Tax=Rhizobacter sp. Root1221 TaxID=1736433 RepID=UPI000A5B8E88|nr:YetF domain-containing protein [Rhizobacter sp. Root1221]
MNHLFEVSVPLWELMLRGSATYWFLFLIFRFVMRRDVGALAIADVLLLVLIADASQNAMAGGYTSLTEGAVVVSTIIGWNFLLDWASYYVPLLRKLAEPPPLLLVSRGRMLHRNMRKEYITKDDLYAKLREHGIEDVAKVKAAYMEADGDVTVIPFK